MSRHEKCTAKTESIKTGTLTLTGTLVFGLTAKTVPNSSDFSPTPKNMKIFDREKLSK